MKRAVQIALILGFILGGVGGCTSFFPDGTKPAAVGWGEIRTYGKPTPRDTVVPKEEVWTGVGVYFGGGGVSSGGVSKTPVGWGVGSDGKVRYSP